jgi:hypothetical protein
MSRCKAFSVRVQYVKAMMRCAEPKSYKECQPFHWCRSFSKETSISFKPLLSGIQALRCKYWSHPLLTEPNQSSTCTWKNDNNVEEQMTTNHPFQLPELKSSIQHRDPFTGLPYIAATTRATPYDSELKPFEHQNTVVTPSNTKRYNFLFHSFFFAWCTFFFLKIHL